MINNIKIYTLSAKAEHGKNFTADLIQKYYEEKYNKRVCQLANANYLKFLAKYIGWDGTKTEHMRKLLQEFGTEYIRDNFGQDFWVDEIIRQITVLRNYFDVFLITDPRFENEIYKLNDEFGIENVVSLHIERVNENFTQYQSSLTPEQLNHPSETALNGFEFDEYLVNSTKDELYDNVKSVVDCYEKYWSEVNNEA